MAPQAGWRPVGILDDRLTVGRMLDNVPILGRLGDFNRVVAGLSLRGMRPRQIVITGPHDEIGVGAIRSLQKEAYAERLGVTNLVDLLRLGPPLPAHDERRRCRRHFAVLSGGPTWRANAWLTPRSLRSC